MVQFLSIIFFFISSIFVGFFKSSRFLCHSVSVGTEGAFDLHNRFNYPTTTVMDMQEAQGWEIMASNIKGCRFQGPRGLRRRSAAVRWLVLLVWIPPEALMFVSCWVFCVVRKRSLRRTDQPSWQIPPSLSVIAKTVQGRPLPGIGSKRHAGWGGGYYASYLQTAIKCPRDKKKYNLQL